MKKSRIIVMAVALLAIVSLFSGNFNLENSLSNLALAGYGGDSDSDKDIKDPKLTHARVTKAYVGESIKLSARAKDSDSGIDEVTLRWRFQGGNWKSIEMKNNGSREYFTTIPAQDKAGVVEYYIKAEDEEGNVEHVGKSSDPLEIQILNRNVAKKKTVTPQAPQGEVKGQEAGTVAPSVQNQPAPSVQEEGNAKEERTSQEEMESEAGTNSTRNISLAILAIAVIAGGIWFIFKK